MKHYHTIFIVLSTLLLLCQTACEDNLQQECISTLIVSDPFENTGDNYSIEEADIWGDCLMLNVSYSGGCETHIFTLYSGGAVLESIPLGANVVLHHNDPDDPCDSIVSEIISFDLSPLQVANDSITVIHIANSNLTLNYTY